MVTVTKQDVFGLGTIYSLGFQQYRRRDNHQGWERNDGTRFVSVHWSYVPECVLEAAGVFNPTGRVLVVEL